MCISCITLCRQFTFLQSAVYFPRSKTWYLSSRDSQPDCTNTSSPTILHPPHWVKYPRGRVAGVQYTHHSSPTMAPSWAEVAGRGGVQPPVRSTNSSPPPASDRQRLYHPFDTLLKLYWGCVQERRWARLILETCDGDEKFNFCCSGSQAGTASSTVSSSARRHARKRQTNEKRREKERKRRDVWKEKRGSAINSAAAVQAVHC